MINPIHRYLLAMTADLRIGESRSYTLHDIAVVVHCPPRQVAWWVRTFGSRFPQFSVAHDAAADVWTIARTADDDRKTSQIINRGKIHDN